MDATLNWVLPAGVATVQTGSFPAAKTEASGEFADVLVAAETEERTGGTDAEATPDGPIAQVLMLDHVLAQLPSTAGESSSGSETDEMAMVDLDRVRENWPVAAEVLADAAFGSDVFGLDVSGSGEGLSRNDGSFLSPELRKTMVPEMLGLGGSGDARALTVDSVGGSGKGFSLDPATALALAKEVATFDGDPAELKARIESILKGEVGTADQAAASSLPGSSAIGDPTLSREVSEQNGRVKSWVEMPEHADRVVIAEGGKISAEGELVSDVSRLEMRKPSVSEQQGQVSSPRAFVNDGRVKAVDSALVAERSAISGSVGGEKPVTTVLPLKDAFEVVRAEVSVAASDRKGLQAADVLGGAAVSRTDLFGSATKGFGFVEAVSPGGSELQSALLSQGMAEGTDSEAGSGEGALEGGATESASMVFGAASTSGGRFDQIAGAGPSERLEVSDLTEVVDRVTEMVDFRRPGKIEIRLNPEELGTIELTIMQAAGQVSVDVQASDERVRSTMAAHRGDMIQQLEAKGLTVGSVTVGAETAMERDMGSSDQATWQNGPDRQDFERATALRGHTETERFIAQDIRPEYRSLTTVDYTA